MLVLRAMRLERLRLPRQPRTHVDLSAGSQRYIEDCAVCCRPIEIALRVGDDGELIDVSTQTDND